MTTLQHRIRILKAQGRTTIPMAISDVEKLIAAAEKSNVVPLPRRPKMRKLEVAE